MPEISDIEILDEGENRSLDFPCVILDADFARKAIEEKELVFFVHKALEAMELSGQRICVLKETVDA